MCRNWGFRHHKFRAALRAFFDAEVRPDAADDDEAGEGPTLELNQKMGQAGVLAAVVGLVPIGEMCGIALPGGVPCKRGVRVGQSRIHVHRSRVGIKKSKRNPKKRLLPRH